MTKKTREKLKKRIHALESVLEAAVTNSCQCNGGKVNKKTDHQSDCWCHMNHADLMLVQSEIDIKRQILRELDK